MSAALRLPPAKPRAAVAPKKPRAKRTNPERAIQQAIVDYLATVLSADRYIVYANPNGAKPNRFGLAPNYEPGFLCGVFDLSILCPGGTMVYFEVKTEKGKMSPAQEEFSFRLLRMGVKHAVVKSIDDVKLALAQHQIGLRR